MNLLAQALLKNEVLLKSDVEKMIGTRAFSEINEEPKETLDNPIEEPTS